MHKQNFTIQRNITILAIALFAFKLCAYFITHSVAILTDALESTANIAAGFLGMYSLNVSARPKDFDHPYGHGKVEFISAAIEGTLIISAALIIIYGAIKNITVAHTVHKLDWGIAIIFFTALVNYFAGFICIKIGKKNNSLPLISSGFHLKSDTYTTLGIVAGLIILFFTKIVWIDSAIAILFACIILFTGYKIIRSSVAGIMDEADEVLLKKVIDYLNQHRKKNWIDLHNLRIIKYGAMLHLDAHLTVPWYFNVIEAHREIDALTTLLRNEFGDSFEIFVLTDACLEFSCAICIKDDCEKRKSIFIQKIEWNKINISENEKHRSTTI